MKEVLIYMAMCIALLTAIALPYDNGWLALLKGLCIGIFICLIPIWVRLKNGDFPS